MLTLAIIRHKISANSYKILSSNEYMHNMDWSPTRHVEYNQWNFTAQWKDEKTIMKFSFTLHMLYAI